MKYSLSPPRGEPEGFSLGSGYISLGIPTEVIIKKFSISKNYHLVLSYLVVTVL